MIRNVLITWFRYTGRAKTTLCDKPVVKNGRELGGYNLICNSKGTADAGADKSIKAVNTPPKPSTIVPNPLESTTVRMSLMGLGQDIFLSDRVYTRTILVVEAKINGKADGNSDYIPKARSNR